MVASNANPTPDARPPTVEDLLDLCRRLNEAGAKYVGSIVPRRTSEGRPRLISQLFGPKMGAGQISSGTPFCRINAAFRLATERRSYAAAKNSVVRPPKTPRRKRGCIYEIGYLGWRRREQFNGSAPRVD